jgi:hypothetical protein
MAVGDFTIDSTTLRSSGNAFTVSGTVEIDTNATQSDIFPNGYIVSFSIDRNEDDDDGAVPRVHTNASDFSTADNGSIYAQGSAGAPDTYAWTASFIM